jgi:YidC/Oxa1 family membrane protein insertase
MLDAFAYPVSALMQLLHDLLSHLFVPDSGAAWVGSLLLLVATIRLLLLRPSWSAARSARRVAALRPRLAELKEEHGSDQTAYLAAVRRVQREEGVGAASVLPVLVQLPVFVGLYHLLARFADPGSTGTNGVFGPEQVSSFAHARLLDVPLAAAVRSPADVLQTLQAGLSTGDVLLVVLPLLLVAAAATFVNGLVAARRQRAIAPAADDAMATALRQVTDLMVWVAPAGLLAAGLLVPVPLALVLYWAVNGTWTTMQTLLVNRALDRAAEAATG